MTDTQLLYLALAWGLVATVVAVMAYRRGCACEDRTARYRGLVVTACNELRWHQSGRWAAESIEEAMRLADQLEDE